MEKILNRAPEIKALEDKLNATADIHPKLDKVLEDLTKITNIAAMIPTKADAKDGSALNKTSSDKDSSNKTAPAGNKTKASSNKTKSANATKTVTPAVKADAPKGDAAAATDKAALAH